MVGLDSASTYHWTHCMNKGFGEMSRLKEPKHTLQGSTLLCQLAPHMVCPVALLGLLPPPWAVCFRGSAWACLPRDSSLTNAYKSVSLAMLLCQETADTIPSHLSRTRLAGSEPSLVQATPGQAVQLFCPGNIPPEFQARWQKEGRPISSNRYV